MTRKPLARIPPALYPAVMTPDDDDPWRAAPRPKPAAHDIGQPLDTLSVSELDERIALLGAEIARLEGARRAKSAAGTAANSAFKSSSG